MSTGSKKTSGIIIAIVLIALGSALYYLYSTNKSESSLGDSLVTSSEPIMVEEDVTETAMSDEDGSVVLDTDVENFSEDPDAEPVNDESIKLEEDKTGDFTQISSTTGELQDFAVGDELAPIQVVQYSSLTCSHCGSFHLNTYPRIKQDYIDTNKVRMIFREFPLNKAALDATLILRCMPADKYEKFQTLLYQTQDQWAFGSGDHVEKLKQNAKLAGMSEDDFNACLTNEDLQKALTTRVQEASQKYEIKSTPTFVINEDSTLVGNQPYEIFVKRFDALLADKGIKTMGDTMESTPSDDAMVEETITDETTTTEGE